MTTCEPAIKTCEKLLSELLEAKHYPKQVKEKYLIRALAKAELLEMQIRLILELKICSQTNCFKLLAQLRDIKRMIGAWTKSTRI